MNSKKLRIQSRTVRLFLSSTFRDFGEERDLLVRRVFPALRARLKDRFVELVDVDLRWGITVEEAERGEVLPICLAEIDRSRPYFIGMLGERYGWIPPHEGPKSHFWGFLSIPNCSRAASLLRISIRSFCVGIPASNLENKGAVFMADFTHLIAYILSIVRLECHHG